MGDHKFKVIVVGGGPVGLIAAHILSQAGFDFVILEKHHTVYPELGNALALWPHAVRVLDQLRILEPLQPLSTTLANKTILTHEGRIYSRNASFYRPTFNHGYPLNIFHRHELLKSFYTSLSEQDKEKVLLSKRVTSIETTATCVHVHTADGGIEEGDMVIGADGVHSITRQIARQLALASSAPQPVGPINDEKPWLTTYRVLYGNILKTPDLTPGDVYESHGKGVNFQFFIGREHMWFFAYEELPKQTKERAYYTQQDTDELAAAYGDLRITDKLCFRDVYANKLASGLTNLEEGVMKQWSWGRIVLVGDAAHKLTPNTGWGFNSSVHDLVVLVNKLRGLVHDQDSKTEEVLIETPALEALFKEYQAERIAHIQETKHIATHYTRLSGWRSGWKNFLDRYIFPHVGADNVLVNYAVGAQVRTAPVLNWLNEPNFKTGEIPWGIVPVEGEEAVGTRKVGSWVWGIIERVMPVVVSVL